MKGRLDRITIIFLAMFAGSHAGAQWVRLNNAKVVRPQLSVGSLSLSASPSVVNLTLVPKGQSAVSATITINNLLSLTALGTFSLWASFSTSAALASPSGDTIPASAVLGKCSSGSSTSFTAFTQISPFSTASSLLIYQTNSLATLLLNQAQTCNLMIDLTTLPALPAATYSGTLIIQAQAF